jgi:hypothetical protein
MHTFFSNARRPAEGTLLNSSRAQTRFSECVNLAEGYNPQANRKIKEGANHPDTRVISGERIALIHS